MTDFHFMRPLWLIALLALPIIVWLLSRLRVSQSGWHKVLPPHLAKQMIDGGAQAKQTSLLPAALIYILVVSALAGPAWQKIPQPVYQVDRGSVIIMDMSYSMYSTDVAPNRLTRARFKAIDLLDKLTDGGVGLIAYAGDAFIISPLTEDVNNIKLLLPSLSPELMPELGSNPLAALTIANEMLTNAGHIEGDIYWFTDGIDYEDVSDINDWSSKHNHNLNILGVGTSSGAPIKLPNGELLKDNTGAIVIPKLSEGYLYGVAQNGNGKYRTLTNDLNDIETLIAGTVQTQEDKQQEKRTAELQFGDQWQEAGPYLLIPVLLLLLGYFRRGTLQAIMQLTLPLALLFTPTEQAMALDWQSLWKTKDQQGQQAFNEEAFSKAAEHFKNPMWQGSSHYKAGNFEAAAEAFAQTESAEGYYNQGNALAKLQKLDEAIKAYEKALSMNEAHEDAKANKALLEQLKQQQEQQNQQGDSQQQGDSDDNKDQQNDSQDSEQSNQGNQQESQDGQQNQQDQQQEQDQNGDAQDQSQQSSDQQNGSNGENQSQNSESNSTDNSDAQSQGNEPEQQQQEEAQSTNNDESQQQNGEPANAQLSAAEQQANAEKEQKHQQLLKKVTDDPYLLLRNKMQLEYQKRRQNGSTNGAKKKW